MLQEVIGPQGSRRRKKLGYAGWLFFFLAPRRWDMSWGGGLKREEKKEKRTIIEINK